MKVFVPRNIEKGLFNMHFQLGPLTVSLVQLVLIALWAGTGLMIWNLVMKSGGSKAIATMMALPAVAVFLIIAFFKVSELSLLPFLAKIWRTRFLDTTKKFQNNTGKIDPLEVMIKESHATYENHNAQETKTLAREDLTHKPLSSDDLLS
jgi:hypothetical protein